MKFGVTGTGIQHTMTQQVRLPEMSRESWQRGHEATGEGRTAWEVRLARAKRRTVNRRAGGENEGDLGSAENEGTTGPVETLTPAQVAYLRWLEERAAHIEKIRARIENGTYRIDSATLAEDMLRTVVPDPKTSGKA